MQSVSFTRLRRQLPLFGLFASGSLALLGNAIATVALPWFVLNLTPSPLWASAILLGASVFAASLLPGFHELDRPDKAGGTATASI